MEGYSVTEAASILGVPTERIWELLARGILSGAPDSETGMRVFLQPRPASAPAPVEVHAQADAPRNEPERELSPFRELLTEFRNLTERYGQALLALGESRGEVAALRSRVDLLEARIDLRLSGANPSPAMPWLGRHTSPDQVSTPPATDRATEEPRHLEPAEHDEAHPEADLDARGRRRRTPHRRATDSFAEALARAEDPSLRDLPGAAEAADALAALRDQARAAAAPAESEAGTDAALPRELPAADAVPVPEEPEAEAAAPTASAPQAEAEAEPPLADVVAEPGAEEPEEPAPEAEPDLDLAIAIEPEVTDSEGATETSIGGPADVADQPEIADAAAFQQAAAAALQPEGPAPAEAVSDAAADRAPVEEARQVREPEPEAPPAPGQPEPEPVGPAEAVQEPGEVEAAVEWDRERYTTSLGEPDWYAADDLPFFEPPSPVTVALEVAPERARHPEEPADADRQAEAPVEEAAEEAEEVPAAVRSAEPLLVGDEPGPPGVSVAREEHLIWFGREPEPEPDAGEEAASPEDADGGAEEMEVAGTGMPQPVGASTQRLPGAWDLEDALAALDTLAGRRRGDRDAPSPRPQETGRREPRSPASRAYRRLRRILPG